MEDNVFGPTARWCLVYVLSLHIHDFVSLKFVSAACHDGYFDLDGNWVAPHPHRTYRFWRTCQDRSRTIHLDEQGNVLRAFPLNNADPDGPIFSFYSRNGVRPL
jgi:hypothetical protein